MVITAYILANITLLPIKEAMERKKMFATNVSHELRTPLSVMRTNAEVALLNAGTLTNEELAEALRGNTALKELRLRGCDLGEAPAAEAAAVCTPSGTHGAAMLCGQPGQPRAALLAMLAIGAAAPFVHAL